MKKTLGLAFAAAIALVAFALPATAQASANDPIVFVHGFTGNPSGWDDFKSRFIADGYDSGDFATVGYGFTESNVTIASRVRTAVNALRTSTGKSKVDIVTHSMGGLSSRYYVKNLGGASAVDEFVSIAGPNHGTTTAAACTLLTIQCRQMVPGNSFLRALNSGDETPGAAVRYLTQTSTCDLIVVPALTSTPLAGAQNDNVGCKEHIGMNKDTDVYNGIRAFLN